MNGSGFKAGKSADSREAKLREALSRRPETGRRGEEAAALHMQRLGYRVLDRNWRCRIGELDIVAEDEGTIVFVEVRTRRASSRFGTAAESVDARKRRRLAAAAHVYLTAHGMTNVPIRFDVAACTAEDDGSIRIEHIQGIM